MSYVRKEELAEGVVLYQGDCLTVLPTLGKFDAVVTDPPYGINAARVRNSQKDGWRDYEGAGWDKERPTPQAIATVLGAGQHAIFWGGNYFTETLPPSQKWLVWDKGQTDFSLADCELAWCSFDGALRRINYARALAMKDVKEHYTQKPIEVMRWCIEQLPKGCSTIVDPYLGSGTTGVAAVKLGRQFTGIEVDPGYFDIARRRIAAALREPDMFIDPPKPAQQLSILDGATP